MQHDAINIDLTSEIGAIQAVMVHQPGQEIENMTPADASEVLYDDIISLPLARKEHQQLTGVLNKVTQVLNFTHLLAEVLDIDEVRQRLLKEVVHLYNCAELYAELYAAPSVQLTKQLLEGTAMRKDTLEKFLSPLHHVIPPLPNTFFTRDATMCLHDRVVIGSMAYRVRLLESMLLKAVFKYHPRIQSQGFYFDGTQSSPADQALIETDNPITIEGGDLLVVRDDLVLIGYSERTTASAIDRLTQAIAAQGRAKDFIVLEIPKKRASIHLDMIFTMLDRDKCMIFPPLITGSEQSRAFHLSYGSHQRAKIREYPGLLPALQDQGLDLEPIACGGNNVFHQEREQWNSGANFFALAPGHVIGYRHNIHTVDALSRSGFEVIEALDIINDKACLTVGKPAVVVIDGTELSRGGGGCRCMTMPLNRSTIDW